MIKYEKEYVLIKLMKGKAIRKQSLHEKNSSLGFVEVVHLAYYILHIMVYVTCLPMYRALLISRSSILAVWLVTVSSSSFFSDVTDDVMSTNT